MEREERRARAAERARYNIVTAALEVLADVDISACRIEEIADRAGYSPGALYTYFKNKEELLAAALERMTEEITRNFGEPPADATDFLPAMRQMIRDSLASLGRYRALMFALFAVDRLPVVASIGPGLPERLRVQREGMLAQAHRWMVRGMEVGVLATEPAPKTYVYALNSLVRGFVEQWLESGDEQPPADIAERVVGMFLDGARHREPGPNGRQNQGSDGSHR